MHLATRKMPLPVPLLEPVCLREVFPRIGNLLPCRLVLQYPTPNGTQRAARETVPGVLRAEEKKDAIANELHVDEHDVKPDGTRRSKTSSTASDAGAGRVRSSPDENREFFQKRHLADGPRGSPVALARLAVAGEPVLGNGTLVGGDVPGPSRSPDTAARPATVSISLPPRHTPCYSSATKNEGG